MNNDVSQIYFPLRACRGDIAIAWTINDVISYGYYLVRFGINIFQCINIKAS